MAQPGTTGTILTLSNRAARLFAQRTLQVLAKGEGGALDVTDVATTTLAVRSYHSTARLATPHSYNGSSPIRWPESNPLESMERIREGSLG